MLDSIYIGLTGLVGFSKDLTIIGNNVANLNTAGFKGSQLLFTDLFYRSQFSDNNRDGAKVRLDYGAGLAADTTRVLFTQGDLKQSGNAQDAAIDGNGFFVVRRDGSLYYTRAGQWNFDADGILVSQTQNARVQALVGGSLQDINITGLRTNDGKATTRVSFSGILNSSATQPYDLTNIVAYDAAGVAHSLTATFTNNTSIIDGSWLVEVKDGDGVLVGAGELRFNADGTPAVAFNSFSVVLAGGEAVELFFGEPGSVSGARSLPSSSFTLAASAQDGYGVGSLVDATFDDTGTLVLSYSNGQTEKGPRLALASFDYLQGLDEQGGSLFAAGAGEAPLLGFAQEGPFGTVRGGTVEMANVDLSQQFSDLIISQRGYQASSQVISTANEMIQQLYDIKARR